MLIESSAGFLCWVCMLCNAGALVPGQALLMPKTILRRKLLTLSSQAQTYHVETTKLVTSGPHEQGAIVS